MSEIFICVGFVLACVAFAIVVVLVFEEVFND